VALVFQLVLAPMSDDRKVTTDTPHSFVGEFVWTPEPNRCGWTVLLGQEPGSGGVSPYTATRGPRIQSPAANLKITQTLAGLNVLPRFSVVYRTLSITSKI
jgi:hypothetical protein